MGVQEICRDHKELIVVYRLALALLISPIVDQKCMMFIFDVVLMSRPALSKICLNDCFFSAKGIVRTLKPALVAVAIEAHAGALTAEIEVLALGNPLLELTDQYIPMVVDENPCPCRLAFAVKCPMVDGIFILDESVVRENGHTRLF